MKEIPWEALRQLKQAQSHDDIHEVLVRCGKDRGFPFYFYSFRPCGQDLGGDGFTGTFDNNYPPEWQDEYARMQYADVDPVYHFGMRLEGVLSDKIRRDGINATRTIVRLVSKSHYREHIQAVLLQGITFAGFNVVDLQAAFDALKLPVIAVSRRQPDMEAVRTALLDHVPGGQPKWRLIQKAGPVEPAAGVYVQRAGISLRDTETLIERLALNGRLPEPLRTAHLIAGGIVQGESRHRA